MIPAIWKSAALAGVVGVGCGGVYYVQRDLATTAPIEPGRFSELDPTMKGDPAPALTGADPIELPTPPASKAAAQPAALASLDSPAAGTSSLDLGEAPPEQGEPQGEPVAEEPAADSMLALVDPAAEASGNPWAKRPNVGEPAEPAGAAAKSSTASPAAASASSDPWGDLPGLNAGKDAPKSQPNKLANSAPIDLVANPEEGRSVDGAHDAKLQALPPGHTGPVLMEVPKAPKQTASATELFLPEIGDQSEPAPGQEIQQVQNQLPEIRPRSRSTIPTAGAEPQAANPFSGRQPVPAGGPEALPEIRPAAGAAPAQTAIVPASEFNAAAQPAAGNLAPSPFGGEAPASGSPTPAAGAAPRSGNPFEFVPAGGPGASPSAAPVQAPEPTPAGAFSPAVAEPAKAPVRSTIPGQVETGNDAPSKFSFPPAQPEPAPAGIPAFAPAAAPAAAPANSIPGNRDAIPELQGGVFGIGAPPAAPALNGSQAPVGSVPPAGSNPFGSSVPTSGAPVDPQPVRRDPIVDLVGDGTVASNVTSGPQQPEIKIEKIAPAEAVIGEPLIYQILVRNVGQSTAHRVIVEDRIPLGATCQGTIPQAETAEKRLFWKLGDMRPGEAREIKVKLTPTQAGSIGSVATVSFAAEVAATTIITAPELKVDLQAPKQVIIGEASTLRIRVQNTGQGQAKGVFLRALLPSELKHPGGNDLEYEIGNLGPGQSKDVELNVTAEKGGNLTPKVIVSTNNQEQDSRIAQVNAIDTRLKVVRTGPAKRFVGRPAQYLNTVTNQSLDPLRDVTVVETLPLDLEPVTGKLSNGQWDPQSRTITWRLPQLGPGEKAELPIDLVPKKPGAFDGGLLVSDASGNRANVATHVDVAGYSNLVVDVVPDGPVAVGEQVSMRLSVRNRGTAAASNVQTVFEVPPHLKFVNANGPVQHQAAGNVVHFAALDVLPPGGEQEFDIILTAAQEGDARVKVDLYSDDHKTQPLHEEGEVRVYRDQNVRPAVSESFAPAAGSLNR